MENEEIEAPYRIISLSEIGSLVLGKWSQIYVGSKCIGRLGDLSFKPSKYDYIPDTQLKIQMIEPFLLSIQKPIYAIQSVKFVRIYSTETISYTCINDADDTSRITGSNYVDIFDYTNRTILNAWSWAFSHEPVEPKWWHHIVPKTWLR